MAYASWSVVFGEQPSAAKWNILGTNDSSFNDGTGIANGKILPNHLLTGASTLNTHVWDSYTPSFANTTLGNGAVAGKYIQIGKTVHFRASFVMGSTSAVSTTPTVSLPVTSVALTTSNPIGIVDVLDAGVNQYFGSLLWASTTTATPNVLLASGTYTSIATYSSTVPITWGTSDAMYIHGTYEAA